MNRKYKYYVNENKREIYVTAQYAGKEYRAVSKCAPEDDFDMTKGCLLARARLDAKIAEKRHKKAKIKLDAVKKDLTDITFRLSDMKSYFKFTKSELKKCDKYLRDIEHDMSK